jgi:uncharacterized lipoprotein NlpE involved in copper resistance
MKKFILLFIILFLFLVGCNNKPDVQSDYPNAIGWNDLSYGLSVEEVSREKLVNKVGEVQRKKEPMPVKNGDANFVDVGSSIYEITDVEQTNAIAVEVNGKIYKAYKNGPLN